MRDEARRALEAAIACRHSPEDHAVLCVACAARAIAGAVDVTMGGRRLPGRWDVVQEADARLDAAIKTLGAQVVDEDAYDRALRILADEVAGLRAIRSSLREDVARLTIENADLGLALHHERESRKRLALDVDQARRVLRGIRDQAAAMGSGHHEVVAIGAFAGVVAQVDEEEVPRAS